jgi:hypothetical protein
MSPRRIPAHLSDRLKRAAEANDVDETTVLDAAERLAAPKAAE